MSDVINLTSITNYLQTKYDIDGVISALDKVLAKMFKKQQKISDILDKYAPFPLSSDLKKLAKEHSIDLENDPEADTFFGDVREAIMNLPILTITVGVSPNLDLVKDVNAWAVANVKGFVAIDFVVDHSLIAGARISFKGKSRDYSVKKETTGLTTIQNADLTAKS